MKSVQPRKSPSSRVAHLDNSPAPRLAHAVQLAAFALICGYSLLWLLALRPDRYRLIGAILCILGSLAIMVRLCWPGCHSRRARRRIPVLLTLAALTFAPVCWFGAGWLGVPGFLDGAILLMYSGAVSWCCFALLVLLTGAIATGEHPGALGTAYFVGSTLLSGLSVFGLTRLNDMVLSLRAAREGLAVLAVEQERLRFARDLHDLLGFSLSTIVLRGELTARLVRDDPGRAHQEVDAILGVARQALTDVRQVARSYRHLSLSEELSAARSVLGCAGIEVEVRGAALAEGLSATVSTVLGTVLREGTTNILRHSTVRWCLIEVRREGTSGVLTLVNDGVPEHGPSSGCTGGPGGTGLGNLAARVAAIGGTLGAGVLPGHRFRLAAEVPLAPVSAVADPVGTAAGRDAREH
ncbi:hypothetical protein TUSST3_03800 [Streptomyces sp. TUS-ST3]|jgi:two-component system sensor histidine kinase DesK|uniref:sensor histidine kinase n=1 Tax=Streptomyces sp. TUS-ST3 TaxID=3025591 RepID=UPI00235B5365|nr:histidine kinase [Streptomyces sp. TUS-ST3]GLP63759.1 hypothetical protein TUSST3_03800 [Streptomyces sp. TUS-ST3]